ncbi:MAG: tripartite tricarboxylate transporter substrate binding protein [Pseudomonadota bacterium]|nr:tripartite tricarboxylate transporter substrate binding protein [Pseudomonadota bacterium]
MFNRFAALLLTLLMLAGPEALAQADKATRIIVAFPPGGPVDLVARTISEELGKQLGQRVIVENKPGANGAIAADLVTHAAPDGTVLWLTSVGAAAINPALYPKLSYDMQRDFAPVSLVVNNDEMLVVNASDPASNAAEFIANARKRGTPTPIASSGTGSIPHLAMEQLADATKAPLLHVPYKGAAPAITDVMGGQVAGFFGDIPGLIGFVRGGKLKAIGIAASKRHPLFPDVRTLVEQGIPAVDSNNWYALFAPVRTPPATLAKLNEAVRATIAAPAVRDKLAASGAEPAASSPQELAAMLRSDIDKWGKLVRAKNITAE